MQTWTLLLAMSIVSCSRTSPAPEASGSTSDLASTFTPTPTPAHSQSWAPVAPVAALMADPAARHAGLLGSAVEVHEKEGNLYVSDHEGTTIQLTASNLDSRPVLSPDLRHVLFLRDVQDDAACCRRDLYLISIAPDSAPALVLKDDPDRPIGGDKSRPVTALNDPGFYPDGHHVLVSVPSGARGALLLRVALSTHEMTWVTDSFDDHVMITRGPFAGDLIVTRHVLSTYENGKPYRRDRMVLVNGTTGETKIVLGRPLSDQGSKEIRARLRFLFSPNSDPWATSLDAHSAGRSRVCSPKRSARRPRDTRRPAKGGTRPSSQYRLAYG